MEEQLCTSAEEQMAQAKRAFTDAAHAALRGDQDAQQLAKEAWIKVQRARARLAELDTSLT